MNSNPYPAGRWTPRGNKGCRGPRVESESLNSLRRAPLRELFWAADESALVLEARVRIEAALTNAAAAVTELPEAPDWQETELKVA